MTANVPKIEIHGGLDADYINNALRRAGRATRVSGPLAAEPLLDGRTGTRVERISSHGNAPSYVLKEVPGDRGVLAALETQGEAEYWRSGAIRTLPNSVRNPIFDVAWHADRRAWWILMDDVGAGLLPWGQWSEAYAERLLTHLARLHAMHWSRVDANCPTLPPVEGGPGLYVFPNLHIASGEPPRHPCVPRVLGEMGIIPRMTPMLLDFITDDQRAFYLKLLQQWRRVPAALARFPNTLVHGDCRQANIAFFDDHIALIDWEFSTRAPATVDLGFHWLIHYWVYPPSDGKSVADRDRLLDFYYAALRECDVDFDRASFDTAYRLGWLRTFMFLAFLMIDPLTEPDVGPEHRERARDQCERSFDFARKICEAHL